MNWLKSLISPGNLKDSKEVDRLSPDQLREDNQRLSAQLRHVIATAAENEAIWRHFIEIERLLWGSREFEPLIRSLIREIKARFNPHLVVLHIGHPEVLERFFPNLTEAGEEVEPDAWICPLAPNPVDSASIDHSRPCRLGVEAVASLIRPTREPPLTVGSAVLIPLTVHELLFGSLLLGSRDSARYGPDDGTELLEQLGAKIALCMENCLAYERVKELSDQDPLTGLLNFFQIHTVMEREFRRARRTGSELAVLVIELNFVEETGDHLDMGGPVLCHVARLLTAQFPDGKGFIGRCGSHEFLIVMPYARSDQAEEVAENLASLIRRSPLRVGNAVVLIHPRIGIASLREDMNRPHDLFDSAMNRLYQAKPNPCASTFDSPRTTD